MPTISRRMSGCLVLLSGMKSLENLVKEGGGSVAKAIGFDPKVMKHFTCYRCGAIVEYAPNEEQATDRRDEGTLIYGLYCPNCGNFHRTNP